MKTNTTADVAETLNIHARTVRGLAVRHSVGRKHGRDWQFTAADVKRLRQFVQVGPGNPHFLAGKRSS